MTIIHFVLNNRILVPFVAHIFNLGLGLLWHRTDYCLWSKNSSQTWLNGKMCLIHFSYEYLKSYVYCLIFTKVIVKFRHFLRKKFLLISLYRTCMCMCVWGDYTVELNCWTLMGNKSHNFWEHFDAQGEGSVSFPGHPKIQLWQLRIKWLRTNYFSFINQKKIRRIFPFGCRASLDFFVLGLLCRMMVGYISCIITRIVSYETNLFINFNDNRD